MLQFAQPPMDFAPQHYAPQHYAFLLDDEHFDRTYARIRERGIEHWADPQRTGSGRANTEQGGRGVYFLDPAGQ